MALLVAGHEDVSSVVEESGDVPGVPGVVVGPSLLPVEGRSLELDPEAMPGIEDMESAGDDEDEEEGGEVSLPLPALGPPEVTAGTLPPPELIP